MIAVGIDPDLHHTGLALVEDGADGRHVVAVKIASIARNLRGGDAVRTMICELGLTSGPIEELLDRPIPNIGMLVVESQQLYLGGDAKKAKPQDLINLAHVAGAALAVVEANYLVVATSLPKPREWKGQVPKAIHQGRILGRLGWEYTRHGDWCEPTRWPGGVDVGEEVRGKAWSHVVDAIGLACWGLDRLKEV